MAAEPERWIEPTPVPSTEAGEGLVLSSAQVQDWRERGFTLVDGVIPYSMVAEARSVIEGLVAGAGDEGQIRDFGSDGTLEFPTGHAPIDAITLHSDLLTAVSQLLGVQVEALRLTQSDVWAKYGHAEKDGNERSNDDQRIHMDYPNHYLTHPPVWSKPEAVEMILYFDDVSECEGATALVPREGEEDPAYAWPYQNMPGFGALRWVNDREAAEAELKQAVPDVAEFRQEHLYSREVRARFRLGTVLFYRHDLWHRGTWLREGRRRLAQNLCFRRADAEWIHSVQPGSAWRMYRPGQPTERLIANASVSQRCVLGFPAPGHSHWTPERLEAVRARYGPLGMDMAPYEKG
ncbi:MAG: hypothetical protein CL917_14610 [Deltaproteobacteria bacterium]|nr:hypothetical protein [Deltaproteobacteria bacterium]